MLYLLFYTIMQINFIQNDNVTIAHIQSEDVIISNTQDAVELLMNCRYQDADSIIINEENLLPGFFDLKTKLAGDILQKFSTYDGRLAIIGEFTKYDSKSLQDFIYESNKARRINFVSSIEQAIESLR